MLDQGVIPMGHGPSWKSDERQIAWGVALSLAVHAVIVLLVLPGAIRPADYAVESGSGGVEVHLIAAPAMSQESGSVEAEAPALEAATAEEPVTEEATPAIQRTMTQPVERPAGPEARPPADLEGARGDGSSPVPGKDSVTMHTAGGALAEAKPDYLRNPAPAYPAEARRRGWQGLVLIRVSVAASGQARSARIDESSGYSLLDESALRTVKRWRFRPARLGGIPMESEVLVPVRFDLTL